MSKRLQKQGEMLKLLSRTKPQMANAIVKSCDKDLIEALCECSLNVLRGVVPLSSQQRRKLCRFKNHLRALSNKNISIRRKKALLQKGGFLPALLSPILGILGSLLG